MRYAHATRTAISLCATRTLREQPSAYALRARYANSLGQGQIPRLSILINLELLNSTVCVAWP
ncbi:MULTISPECIES: hypothetical protein [unclassified Moorena]|uniref:hypothetical protein n=1 Tax=unclassified Moorena TaxID=2683338 RepID=UPI001400A909|nr:MULTISPECIES: hypothetical protein [unclassified Moorena]NEO12792.1 hypothetical protein [Moorena sp. SIO3E8]NEO50433.1 hypothetical protein [Moorena sp. SIO4A3]NEP99567.1 hypothetical protein [Moorena sp. SIO3F7]